MSDPVVLRSVLADPSLACTGFIAMDERDCYLAAGAALDFAVVAIDFASCTGKDDALARFARALRFPEWFGGNWDALQDCLSDLSWLRAEGYLLILDNVAQWREADDESFGIALEILEQASNAWRLRPVPFWAVVPVPDPFEA
ncbi:MAG TPA: barstar family protein [Luteimonas sp.]|nr:barstar family protein [Luteimonas sp.]